MVGLRVGVLVLLALQPEEARVAAGAEGDDLSPSGGLEVRIRVVRTGL